MGSTFFFAIVAQTNHRKMNSYHEYEYENENECKYIQMNVLTNRITNSPSEKASPQYEWLHKQKSLRMMMKPDKFFVLVCPCVPETMPAAMNLASPYDSFFESQMLNQFFHRHQLLKY